MFFLRWIIILTIGIMPLAAEAYIPANIWHQEEHPVTLAPSAALKPSIVNYVQNNIDNLHYSSYKLGGSRFDPNRGIYVLDCSNYVDQVLEAASPHAYLSLVNSSGAEFPNSQHYYNFFRTLANYPTHYWNKIDEVNQLRPGDILVFRRAAFTRKHARRRHISASGHVMVVMDTPKRHANSFSIRVADSAPVGHSEDTRALHMSGIGIGTLVLQADPKTGKPFAYAWREGSLWTRNVKFAMARPLDLS